MMLPPPPFLLPVEPATETGPNDNSIIWAPGKFLFIYSLLFIFPLTYIFVSYRLWCITMKWHQDVTSSYLQDHKSPPNNCHKQPLVGWEWVQLQNSKRTAIPPPNKTQMEQGQNNGRGGGDNEEEVRQTKKAQEMSNNVSWAIGKFFSFYFIFCY